MSDPIAVKMDELESIARDICGLESWTALVKRALGRRTAIPPKRGIRLMVVQWKGIA